MGMVKKEKKQKSLMMKQCFLDFHNKKDFNWDFMYLFNKFLFFINYLKKNF